MLPRAPVGHDREHRGKQITALQFLFHNQVLVEKQDIGQHPDRHPPVDPGLGLQQVENAGRPSLLQLRLPDYIDGAPCAHPGHEILPVRCQRLEINVVYEIGPVEEGKKILHHLCQNGRGEKKPWIMPCMKVKQLKTILRHLQDAGNLFPRLPGPPSTGAAI